MKRKAAWCGLSFLAGTFLFCTAGQYNFAALAAIVALLTAIADMFFPSEYRVYAAAVGVSVLCGLFCAKAYALLHISPALALDGKTITAQGVVTECRSLGSDSYVITIDGKADGVSTKLMFFTSREVEEYARVRVTGKVSSLEDTASFPSKTYYFPRGVYLSGTADEITLTGGYGKPFL